MSCPNPARSRAHPVSESPASGAPPPVDPRPITVDVDLAPLVCVTLTIILGVAGRAGAFWILLTRPHP